MQTLPSGLFRNKTYQSVWNIKRSDYLSVKLRLASHLKSTDLEFVYCYRLISEVDENLTQVN